MFFNIEQFPVIDELMSLSVCSDVEKRKQALLFEPDCLPPKRISFL